MCSRAPWAAALKAAALAAAAAVLAAALQETRAFIGAPNLRRGRGQSPVPRAVGGSGLWDKPLRWPHNDNYAKWDPKNRAQTRTSEEAEKILMNTGRIPRPLRLCDVKAHALPMQRCIVANPEERRKAAEMVAIYAVNKLQAKLLLKREFHPVWGHERIMVYGKMVCNYLQADARTCEPVEVDMPLKFKAAFREDFDPFFPTRETQWNKELDKRGLRPDIVQGKQIEALLKGSNPDKEVGENIFCEAILDNVVDLGELVLQHFACHVDREATNTKPHSLNKRLQKRMSKELGINAEYDIKEIQYPPGYTKPTAQSIQDSGAEMPQWNKYKFPRSRVIRY